MEVRTMSKRTVIRDARPQMINRVLLVRDAVETLGAEPLLAEVRALQAWTLRARHAAEKSGNLSAVASLTREARANYELLSDMSERVHDLKRQSAELEVQAAKVDLSLLKKEELQQLEEILAKAQCRNATDDIEFTEARRNLRAKLGGPIDDAEAPAAKRCEWRAQAANNELNRRRNIRAIREALGFQDP